MRQQQPRELTEFTNPLDMIDSQWGTIKYREWCERERDRINAKDGGKVKIVTRAGGMIALSR
jgi:hypothetical protein